VKHALWLLLLCPTFCAALCPAGQAKDESALIQIEQTWARALEEHDVAALNCILANEFEEADATGTLWDRSHMLARSAQERGLHYKLSELHAHVYSDVGYIRGVGVATKDSGERVGKTRFTDIFAYREGRWQCVAGHESAFPPATP
jgi:ketosteroid isomerase-like protein